jgi:hypothetical protein
LPEQLDYREYQVQPALRVHKVLKVKAGRKVCKVQLALQAVVVRRDPKASRVLRGRLVQQAKLVLRVQPD